jgi:hypothetical protein
MTQPQQQLTIVMENRTGAIAEVTQKLAEYHINILQINVDGLEKNGVLHLAVDQFEKALEILRDAGYHVMPEEVLLVQLEDKPGSLAALAVKLADAKVNVRSMRIVKREGGHCLCAIVPEPIDIARALLVDKLVG